MRMSLERIKELREALHDHGFNDDHVNYAIELVIDDDPPHPKTDHVSDILSFSIKAIKEKYPDAGEGPTFIGGGLV